MGGQARASGGSSVWRFLSLSNMLLKWKGVFSITLFILVVTSIGSIAESIDQGSAEPFVRRIGGSLLNHDARLYADSKAIEDAGGFVVAVKKPDGFFAKLKAFWFVVKSVGGVLVNLWYMYFFGWCFYKLSIFLFTGDSSKVTSNIILAVFLLVVLQWLAGFVIVEDVGYEFTTREKLIPFKGFGKFIQVIPLLNDPLYQKFGAEPVVSPEQGQPSPPVINNVSELVDETPEVVVV